MRGFEPACTRVLGTDKRTGLVAEQLGFNRRDSQGDGTNIELL